MLPFYNFIWLTVVAILGLMLVEMMLKAERPLFKAMAVRFNVFLLCCLGVQAWSVCMGQQKPEGYVLREDTVVDGFPLPAGTKLHFRWKKDIESYEYAVFPKPVEWKGVMIKAVERKFYAQKMGEGEEFIEFLESAHQGEYEEFEQVVPKALYMLDNTNLIARLRKDLADKIDEKVRETMWSLVGQVTDKTILEKIPDNLVISVDDYRRINNCFPDIESLVSEYFSEKTELTAKDLKEYAADNCDVMRAFRGLAVEGRFKLDLPLEA